MKLPKTIYTIFLFLLILTTSNLISYAATYDFILTNDTTVKYTTGQEYVEVENRFVREIKNSKFYVSISGEKTFHIPDISSDEKESIEIERAFKRDSLSVKSNTGRDVEYTVEELEMGKGMYVKVPNYKETKYGIPYEVVMIYSTHDYVKKVYDSVIFEYPILHPDTVFEQRDENTNTLAQIIYNLSFEFDENIPPLAKIYPTDYSSNNNVYSFSAQQRIDNPIYLEFGTNQIYKFELSLKTSKTDTIIPEKYSSNLPLLSTNIYQVSLPREFAENNQKVKIENLSPKPTKLVINEEGNVTATFEVPANQESSITVSGYIWVEQKPITEKTAIPNPTFAEYTESIKKDPNLSKYLLPTKYWEVDDTYIQQEANNILDGKTSLLDVLISVYTYVNEKLEYDEQKANDLTSKRIGAKAALEGGPSVCMEYSDAMVAIFRAQGIPARGALGYTSLSTNEDIKISHQWVQIWIPEYGWLSLDPTYESPNMAIGQSIQYVLWNTFYDNNITDINVLTANIENLDFNPNNFEVKVYAVNKSTIPDNLMSYSDIKTVEQSTAGEYINILVKTTTLGKALLIILPIAVVLALLILLLSLIVLLIKRIKTRKASQGQLP